MSSLKLDSQFQMSNITNEGRHARASFRNQQLVPNNNDLDAFAGSANLNASSELLPFKKV